MISTDTPSALPPFDKISELEESCLRVALVRSALELGLFDAIDEIAAIAGGATSGELAQRLGADERALGILLDALCTQGFLDKSDVRYRLAPVAAAYLARGSESYYGRSCLELTLSFEVAGRLTETVRRGRPVRDPGSAQGAGDLWAADFAPHLTLWPVKAEQARALWRRIGTGRHHPVQRVLDVACGAGIHILTLLQDHPEARAVGMDLHPEVLEVTRQVARRMGVEDRVELRTADILKSDFGRESFDLAFFSAILYFFDRDQVVDIFRRTRAALRDGGRLVVHHLLPDEERRLRPAPTLLAVQLLLFHPDSRVYTASEYAAMLEAAGFRDPRSEGEDLVWATR